MVVAVYLADAGVADRGVTVGGAGGHAEQLGNLGIKKLEVKIPGVAVGPRDTTINFLVGDRGEQPPRAIGGHHIGDGQITILALGVDLRTAFLGHRGVQLDTDRLESAGELAPHSAFSPPAGFARKYFEVANQVMPPVLRTFVVATDEKVGGELFGFIVLISEPIPAAPVGEVGQTVALVQDEMGGAGVGAERAARQEYAV